MRFAGLVGVVIAVVACAHPTAAPPPDDMCAPLCSATCGNGRIDLCNVPNGFGCSSHVEECDGTAGASCTDYGYYGGTGVCTNCTFDGNGCNACAVGCVDMPAYAGQVLAASNTNLAVAHMPQRGTSVLTLLDASLNEVATTQLTYLPMGMVAVSDGWLVVDYDHTSWFVQHVNMAGTVASPPQPLGDCGTFAGIAYGPGGRALVLCDNYPDYPQPPTDFVAVILDASGAVVVQPFDVDSSSVASLGTVTTDGTSFFVAAPGQLVVVASDGTISSRVRGYPTVMQSLTLMGDAPVVSWSGSSGWYVVPSDATEESYTAQAFDATGAMVGSPVSISTMSQTLGLQAFNSGLVGTSFAPLSSQPERRFAVARVDAAGSVVATTEVGVVGVNVNQTVGTSGLAQWTNQVVVPFGTGVAVAWSTESTTHVALVTP